MSEPIYFMLYGLGFGLLLTLVINLIRKKSLWNNAVIILIYLVLFFTGAFKFRLVHHSVNWFAGLFNSELEVLSLIGLQVASILGILLVWLSVKDFRHPKTY